MMKHTTLSSLFIVLALTLSSCSMHTGLGKLFGGGGTSGTPSSGGGKHVKATHTAPASPTVSISDTALLPISITVGAGATVTWTNNSTSPVTLTSDTAGMFTSPSLVPAATFKFAFTQAGTFTYHTSSTPPLTGTVIVTP